MSAATTVKYPARELYTQCGRTQIVNNGGVRTNTSYDRGNSLTPKPDHRVGGFQGPAYHCDDATGGVPHWYVYNGLGSVVGEVDPAGNYTASGEYDVYGARRASTQSGTFETRQRFVGGAS